MTCSAWLVVAGKWSFYICVLPKATRLMNLCSTMILLHTADNRTHLLAGIAFTLFIFAFLGFLFLVHVRDSD